MTRKTFAYLLSKEIGGNISEKEREALQRSLTKDRQLKEIYDKIQMFMQEKKSFPDIDIDAKLDEVWNKTEYIKPAAIIWRPQMSFPVSQPSSKHLIPQWARIAATIAIVIALGWMAYYYLLPGENLYSQTIKSGYENLYAVLDDGTRIWLKKNSRIDYNNHFGKKHREIRLTGEAFFDVANNPEVPLTVTARDINVIVKGTAFNVDASSQDIEVALIRGSVSVKDKRMKNTKGILLQPNQKIVVHGGQISSGDSNHVVRDLVLVNDTIIRETQWLKGPLVFQKQQLSDLTKLMENRYGVSIQIRNNTLSKQRFTGSIENETVLQMLDALKQSYPFSYEINGKEIIIH